MFIHEFCIVCDSDKCSTFNFNWKSKPKYSSFSLEEDVWLFLPFVDHYDAYSTTASSPSLGPNWGQRWFAILHHVERRRKQFYRYQQIFLFGYFAHLISLIACYKLIYKVIKESTTGRDDQVNKTAFIVIGSFVFVFTPDVLVYTFNKLPGENAVPELHVAVYLLAWSHAFINPIIYIFFNEFYRKEFCRILKIKVDGESD